MIRIIGQELELRVRAPTVCGEYRILDGMGLPPPEQFPKLECWSGLGPHSVGALRPPLEVREHDCVACGAEWFVPFLRTLKAGQSVSLDEVEECHRDRFGQPMLQMGDPGEFLTRFYQLLRSGGRPENFFPCCRIVKTVWNEAAQTWQIAL